MVSDILFPDVDIILPDGTIIPKHEGDIDYSSINIIYPDDNNKQTYSEEVLRKSIRDILDKKPKLD